MAHDAWEGGNLTEDGAGVSAHCRCGRTCVELDTLLSVFEPHGFLFEYVQADVTFSGVCERWPTATPLVCRPSVTAFEPSGELRTGVGLRRPRSQNVRRPALSSQLVDPALFQRTTLRI